MNKLFVIGWACLFSAALSAASDDVITNVYEQVVSVLSVDGMDPNVQFNSAVGGGMRNECMSEEYMSLCNYVSNHCASIVTDWLSYETNSTVRFVVASAIGFAGFENQTNFASRVLALYEADTNVISKATLDLAVSPDGPPDAENYLALHYDTPGVSNLILRLRAVSSQNGDCARVEILDDILAGSAKEEYLNMKNAGAL